MILRDRKKLGTICVIQGVSHRQLARAAGYSSHAYIGKLLRGEVKTLTPDAALRIAEFLGVPVDDLFLTKVSGPTGRNDQRIA